MNVVDIPELVRLDISAISTSLSQVEWISFWGSYKESFVERIKQQFPQVEVTIVNFTYNSKCELI